MAPKALKESIIQIIVDNGWEEDVLKHCLRSRGSNDNGEAMIVQSDHYRNARERTFAMVTMLSRRFGGEVSKSQVLQGFKKAPSANGRAVKLADISISIALGELVQAGRIRRTRHGWYAAA